MLMNTQDKKDFIKIHSDAIYPMIKILVSDTDKDYPHIRLYSVVKRLDYLIPVHQYWHNTITLEQALSLFKGLCLNVSLNYIPTENDIKNGNKH